MPANRIAARILAIAAGALLGFFGSLNSIFSDGGSSERTMAILLVAAAYGVVTLVCALLDRGSGWTLALWVWAPGVLFVAAYVLLGEWSATGWALFVMAMTLGTSVVGAIAGGTLARNRTVED
jgi:hypothetical protein